MYRFDYILVAFSVLVLAAGQVMFKFAAGNFTTLGVSGIREALLANILPTAVVAAALSLYFLSTVGWIIALRTVPLSTAYMFNALAFIVVPTFAVYVFGEQLPRYFWLGTSMILVGVCIILQ
jgi:drug/metabolite transporter (DMT)-like permease